MTQEKSIQECIDALQQSHARNPGWLWYSCVAPPKCVIENIREVFLKLNKK